MLNIKLGINSLCLQFLYNYKTMTNLHSKCKQIYKTNKIQSNINLSWQISSFFLKTWFWSDSQSSSSSEILVKLISPSTYLYLNLSSCKAPLFGQNAWFWFYFCLIFKNIFLMIKITLLGPMLTIHLNASPLLIKQEGETWWLVSCTWGSGGKRKVIHWYLQYWVSDLGESHGALQQNVEQERKSRFWGNMISSRLRFLACVWWTGYSNTLHTLHSG